MLITTRVDLGLLTDIDMLLFFGRGLRVGINGIGKLRHFQTNIKDLNNFDESGTSVDDAFFHEIFLYVGTMQQTLPLDNYDSNDAITLDDIPPTGGDAVNG